MFAFSAQAEVYKRIFQNSDVVFYFFHESQGRFSTFSKLILPREVPPPQIPNAFIHSTNIDLALLAVSGPRKTQNSKARTWASESSRPDSNPPAGYITLKSNSRHSNQLQAAVLNASHVLICLILKPVTDMSN